MPRNEPPIAAVKEFFSREMFTPSDSTRTRSELVLEIHKRAAWLIEHPPTDAALNVIVAVLRGGTKMQNFAEKLQAEEHDLDAA